jgi:MFS family permease
MPVNTNEPSENIGFFLGLFSVLIVSVLFILAFLVLGWLGGWLFHLSWWNYRNFFVAGFLINLVIFPIYISGVLEGLARTSYSRFRFYAFIYGTIAMSLLVALNLGTRSDYSWWNYLWAAAYGIYTVWLASRMSR